MRAFLLGFAAAAAALAGAAEARTINFAEIASASGGFVDLGGARARIIAPEPAEILTRAEQRDGLLLVCDGLRDGCRSRTARARIATDTFLTIFLDEGVSLSRLSFNDHFAGEVSDGTRSVVINGVAYTLSELSNLTLTGQTIVINLDAAAAQRLTLRSFDLSALDAPLPAAGVLMLAGLGGIAFATRRARGNATRRRQTN